MHATFKFKQAEIGKFKSNEAGRVSASLHKDCRIYGFTMGEFSLIDLIYSILQKTGSANVITATWSAGIKDAHQIKWMLDSDLIQTYRIITDRSFETRQQKYALSLEQLFGRENIRTSNIHAKFTLIWNADWRIVIRTSMNLNANKTCETFEIEEGDGLFDFHMDFCRTIDETMPVGFCGEKWRANESLKRFIYSDDQPEQKSTKKWYETE